MRTISERISYIQKHFNLNDVELGKVAGVTKQAVGRWRNRDVMPSAQAAILIREKLKVSQDWLINGDGDMIDNRILPSDEFIKEIIRLSDHLSDSAKKALLLSALEFAQQKPES